MDKLKEECNNWIQAWDGRQGYLDFIWKKYVG